MSFLDEQLSEMWTELSGAESSSSTRLLRVLNLWVWMSKALLMRGHPSGMDTTTKVQLARKKLSFLDYLFTKSSLNLVAIEFMCWLK